MLTRDRTEKEAGSIPGANSGPIDADVSADASPPLHSVPEVSLNCAKFTVSRSSVVGWQEDIDHKNRQEADDPGAFQKGRSVESGLWRLED